MEKTVTFNHNDKRLFGILHLPDDSPAERLVMMVIGGAQTRIASHRMYVQLARYLCDNGVAVFRFDYEGLGDSEGDFVGFEYAGPSICSAIDFAFNEFPGLKRFIVWSLCDGAAASMINLPPEQHRITAMILANPFLESDTGTAHTIIKHYYVKRLWDREFWQKVLSFRLNIGESIRSFFGLVRTSVSKDSKGGWLDTGMSMPQCVLQGLHSFHKPIHFLISSDDMQGLEFYDLIQKDNESRARIKNGLFSIRFIKGGDHTFTDPQVKHHAFRESLNAINNVAPMPVPEPVPSSVII